MSRIVIADMNVSVMVDCQPGVRTLDVDLRRSPVPFLSRNDGRQNKQSDQKQRQTKLNSLAQSGAIHPHRSFSSRFERQSGHAGAVTSSSGTSALGSISAVEPNAPSSVRKSIFITTVVPIIWYIKSR